MTRRDASQVAFDVVRQATREVPKPAPKPQKEPAPKMTKGAAMTTAKKKG